ncbi:hypothetical protein H6P81_016033 [Aristolochia fimbriata]|uniref:Secreted protein n=1 Tax=Aristolochia fimbriata TaxID=158543 RepID=A0AAV7EBT1_ARIFI|nr:hypothetical protein H6P81_016033 [Aristolochia fimbriata]
MAFSSFVAGARPLVARATLLPFSSILIFSRSRGIDSVPPSPDLDFLRRAPMATVLASPCTGGAGAAGRDSVASGARWTCASGASGRMSRRLVVRSSLRCSDLPRPSWVAGIPRPFETRRRTRVVRVRGRAQSGIRVYFPPRQRVTPSVLGTPDARMFMDPCECGSPGGLGWIRKRVRSSNFCSTVDAPGPVLRRTRIGAC